MFAGTARPAKSLKTLNFLASKKCNKNKGLAFANPWPIWFLWFVLLKPNPDASYARHGGSQDQYRDDGIKINIRYLHGQHPPDGW
jgi:hypothetical protein